MTSTSGDINNNATLADEWNPVLGNCTCSVLNDWCDPADQMYQRCRDDKSYKCNKKPSGCGWFGTFECTGKCGSTWPYA